MTAVRTLLAGLLAAVGLVLITPSTSYACSCALGSPQSHARGADAVFVGTLLDIEPPPQREIMSSADPNTFTFDVDQVLEGEIGGTVEVVSARDSATCGWEGAEVGEEYVIFAYEYRGRLSTSSCSGNAEPSEWLLDQVEQVTGPGRPTVPDLGLMVADLLAFFRFLS